MALSPEQITEFKQLLSDERKRLEAELLRFAKPTATPGEFETQMKDFGDDPDENASEVEEYVDNLALEATLESQLKEVEEALGRVEQGTYGIDEKTGEEISIERLKAYPAARTAL